MINLDTLNYKRLRQHTLTLLLASVALVSLFLLTGCANKSDAVKINFSWDIDLGEETVKSPLAVQITGKNIQQEEINQLCLIWPAQDAKSNTASAILLPGDYVLNYVSLIDSKDTLYRIEADKDLHIPTLQERTTKPLSDALLQMKIISEKEISQETITSTQVKLKMILSQNIQVSCNRDFDLEKLREIFVSSNNETKTPASPDNTATTTSTNQAETTSDDYNQVLQAYLDVIKNPTEYIKKERILDSSSGISSDPNQGFNYLLVPLSSDGPPALLIGAEYSVSTGYDRTQELLWIASWDQSKQQCKILNYDDPIVLKFQTGTHFSVIFSNSQDNEQAIYYTTNSTDQSTNPVLKYHIKEGKLVAEKFSDDNSTIDNRTCETLNLIPTWDTHYLFQTLVPKNELATVWEEYKKQRLAESTQDLIYTGQLRYFKNEESLAEYQGLSEQMINMFSSSQYKRQHLILVFDKPRTVTAYSVGSQEYRTVDNNTMLGLFNESPGTMDNILNYLDQKHATVICNEYGYWQSDVSLPMSEPRLGDKNKIEELLID